VDRTKLLYKQQVDKWNCHPVSKECIYIRVRFRLIQAPRAMNVCIVKSRPSSVLSQLFVQKADRLDAVIL
jgi:hypothetical protein